MRRFLLLLILSLAASCDAGEDAPADPGAGEVPAPTPAPGQNNVPFGAHSFAYTDGVILPQVTNQDGLDSATAAFYDYWKAAYLREGCGDGRHFVLARVGDDNQTVSEAHGYGMLLLALMAGHDPDAREAFDGMYQYFRDHPSSSSSDLMAWYQDLSCADEAEPTAATDGDLDIAFALLLADKQWGSCDGIDYRAEALDVIDAIRRLEVDYTGSYLLLGDWPTIDSEWYPSTRTSDFMPDHLKSFLEASGDDRWTSVTDVTYAAFASIRSAYSPNTGLVPDFVMDPTGDPGPAPPGFLETQNDGAYYNNACRVPWRIGTDYVVSGDPRAYDAAQAMNEWISGATGGDPDRIVSGYELDGTQIRDWNALAFVAPFGVSAMVDAANQDWLDALWSAILVHEDDGYYADTIKLFSMMVMSGNWWAPDGMPDPCAG